MYKWIKKSKNRTIKWNTHVKYMKGNVGKKNSSRTQIHDYVNKYMHTGRPIMNTTCVCSSKLAVTLKA